MDVLRDYRFYDVDMVHPNFAATSYVWEAFTEYCIAPETSEWMKDILDINIAQNHRPRFPHTQAHQDFCAKYAAKARAAQSVHSYLDLSDAIAFFEAKL
jgi:hypothetical protein